MQEQLRYREAKIESPLEDFDGHIKAAVISTDNPVRVLTDEGKPYYEKIVHREDDIDLSRLQNDGPLLERHDQSLDGILGTVNNAQTDGSKVTADLFVGSHGKGMAVRGLVAGKVLRNLSVGYIVGEEKVIGTHEGLPLVEASKVSLREVSFVALPKDPQARIQQRQVEDSMPDLEKTDSKEKVVVEQNSLSKREEVLKFAATLGTPEAMPLAQRMLAEDEKKEKSEISLESYFAEVVKEQEKTREDEDGLTTEDKQNFSFAAFLNAVCDPTDAESLKCRELEIAREHNKERGANVRAKCDYSIPPSVLYSQRKRSEEETLRTRAITPSNAGGGNLIADNLMANEFVSFLRDDGTVAALCRALNGLQGDVLIPTQTGGTSAVWVANTVSSSDADSPDPNYEQITLQPKSLRANLSWNRVQAAQSTPDVEMLARDDLQGAFTEAMDKTILVGGNTHAPKGIFANNLAANRLAIGGDKKLDYAKLVALQTTLANAKSLRGNLAMVTNPNIIGVMFAKERFAGTGMTLAQNVVRTSDGQVETRMGGLNYRVVSTTQAPATLNSATAATGGAGNLVLFGNFSDFLIGRFGSLDVVTDPYTLASQRTTRLFFFSEVGMVVRRPASFVYYWDTLAAV